MSMQPLKPSPIVLDFWRISMIFLIVGKMLLLLGINAETNGKVGVSDTFL